MKIKSIHNDVALTPYSSKLELPTNIEVEQNGSQDKLQQYIPADHRKTELTSSVGALANLLKASLGSGVLAMPLAFSKAGLVVGSLGVLIIGFICTHSLHILVRTSQELCIEMKEPSLGYAETCQKVFERGPKFTRKLGKWAREIADFGLAATHLGACCVYIVIVAESFQQISEAYNGPDISVEMFCLMCLVPLVPLTQVRKLKYLVPFSALANLVWCGAIVISMYYCYTDMPPLNDRELYTSVESLPLFLTTTLFAMEGVGIVMPVENEMAKPHQFLGCPGVLNCAMVFVVFLYGFVGLSGYLKYGDQVRPSLPLNLPQGDILAQVTKTMVALVLLLSYALIYYVPVDVVWRRTRPLVSQPKRSLTLGLIRLFGVLFTVGLATAIPHLELFMGLVGAVCLSILGLLLPAAVETVWLWDRGLGFGMWILWKNLFISLIALIALFFGSFYAIKDLVDKLSV